MSFSGLADSVIDHSMPDSDRGGTPGKSPLFHLANHDGVFVNSYLDGSFVCLNGEQSKSRRKKLEIKNNQCSGSSPLSGAPIHLPSPPGIKARVSHERDRNISTAIRSTLAAPDRTDRPLWAARGSCPATPTRTRGTSSTKARPSSSHSTKWPGRRAWKLSRCAWQSFRSRLIM